MRGFEAELPDGTTATVYEATTALALEAKRRKISYGLLVAGTTEQERNEIIRNYCAATRRKGKQAEHGD